MSDFVVVAHGAFTSAMCGLMWTVQLVVYPQFANVDRASFPRYVDLHSRRIVGALALFAPAEVVLAAAVFLDPAAGIHRGAAFVAGLLLFVGWVSTGVWFAPLHGRLGEHPELVGRLVTTNWLRTAIWTARAGFALVFVTQLD